MVEEKKQTFQAIVAKNESIFEQIGRPGLYQYLLLPIIWWCNISAVSNDVFMVFGGYAPENLSENLNLNENWQFRSIVQEWNLVGDFDFVTPLITSVQLAGSLVGALICGPLSDNFGRYFAILLSIILQIFFGIGNAFATSWKIFAAIRFFLGLANGMYLR